MKKRIMILAALVAAVSMVQMPVMAATEQDVQSEVVEQTKDSAGWHENESGKWYVDENGEQPVDCMKSIDGVYYGFDKNGYMITGWRYFDYGWRYFDETGAIISEGWKEIDGKYYHFIDNTDYHDNQGKITLMECDTIVDGKYLVGADGVWVTTPGWATVGTTGLDYCGVSWCYVKEDGSLEDGWKEIDGKYYYFENGYMVNNYVKDGYLLGDDGSWLSEPGWHSIWVQYWSQEFDWQWYYVKNDGKVYTGGWKEIEGKYYFFSEWGDMKNSCVLEDGSFLREDGAWDNTPGWKQAKYHDINKSYKAWYYVDNNGKGLIERWKEIGGKWYYFEYNGVMSKYDIVDGCYINGDGAWDATTGWKKVIQSNFIICWGYVENGDLVSNCWKEIDGKWYRFGSELIYTDDEVDGYYVDENGVWDPTPRWKKREKWGDKWFYIDDEGRLVRECWKEIDGKWYHFDRFGILETDCEIDGYYVDENGEWIP